MNRSTMYNELLLVYCTDLYANYIYGV